MDLLGGEYTLPEEKIMKEKYDSEFGVCDECGKVGVVLLNFHGEWVCNDCAYSLMRAEPRASKRQVEKVDGAH